MNDPGFIDWDAPPIVEPEEGSNSMEISEDDHSLVVFEGSEEDLVRQCLGHNQPRPACDWKFLAPVSCTAGEPLADLCLVPVVNGIAVGLAPGQASEFEVQPGVPLSDVYVAIRGDAIPCIHSPPHSDVPGPGRPPNCSVRPLYFKRGLIRVPADGIVQLSHLIVVCQGNTELHAEFYHLTHNDIALPLFKEDGTHLVASIQLQMQQSRSQRITEYLSIEPRLGHAYVQNIAIAHIRALRRPASGVRVWFDQDGAFSPNPSIVTVSEHAITFRTPALPPGIARTYLEEHRVHICNSTPDTEFKFVIFHASAEPKAVGTIPDLGDGEPLETEWEPEDDFIPYHPMIDGDLTMPLLEAIAERDCYQRMGFSKLIVAAFVGNLELVNRLLEGDRYIITQSDRDGHTASWWASHGWGGSDIQAALQEAEPAGLSLAAFLKEYSCNEGLKVRILQEIAHIFELEPTHGANITAENVYLNDDHHVNVRALEVVKIRNNILDAVSMRYLAPELLCARTDILNGAYETAPPSEESADVFRFGILMHDILLNEITHSRRAPPNFAFLPSPPPSNVNFHSALWKLTSKCVALSAYQRPNLEDVVKILGQFPNTPALHEPKEPPLQEPRKLTAGYYLKESVPVIVGLVLSVFLLYASSRENLLVDLLWLFGNVFVQGWLFFSVLMFLGGLIMLITKPSIGIPQEPSTNKLTQKELEEEAKKPKEELKQECYESAQKDAAYQAIWGQVTFEFSHLDKKGEMLYPNEWQLTMRHKCLDWLFFPHKPNLISDIFGIILVTPLTNITALSLYYQLYLNEFFHTHFITRTVHYAMVPCITWTYFLFGTYFGLDDILHVHTGIADVWREFLGGYVRGRYVELFALNGSFLVLLSFVIWYLIWSITTKTYAFGFFMVPQLLIMWMAANVFNDWTSYKTGPWWNHSPSWANFIVLGATFACIQAISHIPEPLPPRITGMAHWVSLRDFVETHYKNPIWLLFVFLGQIVWGTLDAYWAGPRLLPLLMLKQMYMLGYMPEQWALVQQLSELARKNSGPALDYIGTGGGLPADPIPVDPGKAPENYQEAREEQHECTRKLKAFKTLPVLKGDPLFNEYQALVARENFLKGLRYRTKLNYKAFGPYVNDPKERCKFQSKLANCPMDAGFRVFLDRAREDIYSLEAKRQQDLRKHLRRKWAVN